MKRIATTMVLALALIGTANAGVVRHVAHGAKHVLSKSEHVVVKAVKAVGHGVKKLW